MLIDVVAQILEQLLYEMRARRFMLAAFDLDVRRPR